MSNLEAVVICFLASIAVALVVGSLPWLGEVLGRALSNRRIDRRTRERKRW